MAAKNVSKRQVSRRQMRMALSIFGCEFSPKSTHGNLHSVSFSRVPEGQLTEFQLIQLVPGDHVTMGPGDHGGLSHSCA